MSLVKVIVAYAVGLLGLMLAAPVVLLGAPFWFVALLTRRLAHHCEWRAQPWDQLVKYSPTIGWKPKPNVRGYFVDIVGDVFQVVTDAEGWLGSRKVSDSDLVVFGDSYAFGYGMDSEAAFFNLNPRLRVKTVAAPGYNMVQELLLMKELAPSLRGKLIVWLIYLGNDLVDNLLPGTDGGYRAPFVRPVADGKSWEIITAHVRRERWTASSGQGLRTVKGLAAAVCAPSGHSRRIFSACGFLISEAKTACERYGARLVVVSAPPRSWLDPAVYDTIDCGYADRKLQDLCRTAGVQYMPLSTRLDITDYKWNDSHWNRRGHRKVAAVLREIYRDHATDIPVTLPQPNVGALA